MSLVLLQIFKALQHHLSKLCRNNRRSERTLNKLYLHEYSEKSVNPLPRKKGD